MTDNAIEAKVDQLAAQIKTLTNQLNKQHERLTSLEKAWPNGTVKSIAAVPPAVDSRQTVVQVTRTQAKPTSSTATTSSWAGRGSFLAKLSTICFILVVALILRTLTDNGLLAAKTGSIIGAAYAAFLIAAGWKLVNQKQTLGPLFPICGALLMYTLVLETHARFAAYTSVTAYSILLLTMLSLAIMGKRYQRVLFYGVGLLGASCTALAIDFPTPFFPYIALFLFAANVIAFSYEYQKTRRVQILLYTMTVLFWFFWAVRLHAQLGAGGEILPSLALSWFLPVTLLTILTLMGFSIYTSFRNGDSLIAFDITLPTVNVLWLYPVCNLVVTPWLGNGHLLGYAGLALSLFHFVVAWSIFKFSRQGGAGICAYVVAGAVLMVMSTLSATDNILLVLPFWSLVAVMLTLASQTCEIGGIRLTSYLLQGVATFLGITYGVFLPGTSTPVLSLLVVGFLAVMSAFQYYWSRKHRVNCSKGFFALMDPRDISAAILLFAALIDGFFMVQLVTYKLLAAFIADPGNALVGAQSIVINVGAMGLMIFGLLKKNREILYTAIGVVVIGGVKTIGYDLFKVHNIPLVLSVFSFAAAAAVGSVVFSRWSQTGHVEEISRG
ncbi:MAG: hypothetical protein K0A99_02565 [Desulfoarculaceae bacterium]|nr:hypothetical protein [Desulfoarculaceae bacterium]